MNAIDLQNLSIEFKRKHKGGNKIKNFLFPEYTPFRAVDDVSFSVKKGEVFGLLGPNGAGKTTIIKAICGFLRPASGRIFINGKEIKSYKDVSNSVAFMFGPKLLYRRMTGYANLEFTAKMLGVQNHKKRIEELAKFVGLGGWLDDLVETYSRGMMCRLAMARALINDPDVLLLDEPTQGIDALHAEHIRERIKKMHKTVFLTTHYIEEAEQLCNSVAIINRGRLLKVAPTEQIKKEASKKNATLREAFLELVEGRKK